jgi:hypothetical protein
MADTRNRNANAENNNIENNDAANPPPPPPLTLEQVLASTDASDHAIDHGQYAECSTQALPPPPRDKLGDF